MISVLPPPPPCSYTLGDYDALKLDSLGVGYSAMVQTSVTGLAALLFALYSHYKKRQTHAENLMRHVIFSSESLDVLFEKVMKEMERMDQGFVFSETVSKKAAEKSNPQASDELRS